MGYSTTNVAWYGVLLGDAKKLDYEKIEDVASAHRLEIIATGQCHGGEELALGVPQSYQRSEYGIIELKDTWGSDWQERLSAALAALGLPDQQAKRYASSHYS